MEIAVSHVEWQPCYRIIPSRFPPIDLFERIAPPEDWEALIALESLTNDRIRQEVGDISLVPVDERVSGPGASVVMAAFTHLNPSGSRFAMQRLEPTTPLSMSRRRLPRPSSTARNSCAPRRKRRSV